MGPHDDILRSGRPSLKTMKKGNVEEDNSEITGLEAFHLVCTRFHMLS